MNTLGRKVRVLQILHTSISHPNAPNRTEITGVDRLISYMLPYWSEHDIEIVIVYPKSGPNWDLFCDYDCELVDYTIGGKFDFSSILKISRIVKENNVHLIHTNGQPIDLFGASASILCGIPMVLTRHVMFDDYLISPRRKAIYKFFDSITFSMCHQVIAICKAGSNHLLKTHPQLNGKVKMVYNGIPVEHFPRKKKGNDSKTKCMTIGFVGRLSEEKGCPDFLKVIRGISDRKYDVQGLIVGGGHCIDEFKSLALEYGIGDIVEFCGLQKNVLPFLNRMDCLLLPSYREGFPLVILEAMAVGLPVIATRIAGIPEQITDGENGFLVSPGDISQMVERCIRLMDERNTRQKFVKKSRKLIEENFTDRRMVEQYAACFRYLFQSYSSVKKK